MLKMSNTSVVQNANACIVVNAIVNVVNVLNKWHAKQCDIIADYC